MHQSCVLNSAPLEGFRVTGLGWGFKRMFVYFLGCYTRVPNLIYVHFSKSDSTNMWGCSRLRCDDGDLSCSSDEIWFYFLWFELWKCGGPVRDSIFTLIVKIIRWYNLEGSLCSNLCLQSLWTRRTCDVFDRTEKSLTSLSALSYDWKIWCID